ncbi:hypothetical protein FNF31_04255 [Cafeteria roenbergensis]|nr:hypothetical protein FNF31_04255 [Cafeteria roenbergensis]KAA0163670.1 hypothetical protein FNF28_04147 [Cafeteria roenbergensis]
MLTWGASIGLGLYFFFTPAGTPRQLIGQEHVLSGLHRQVQAAWDTMLIRSIGTDAEAKANEARAAMAQPDAAKQPAPAPSDERA